jgi:hypothetical protein
MRQQDRLFWAILILIVVLLLAAGFVVALQRGQAPSALETYLPDETDPAVVVHNAYVAARRQDLERFLGYFEAPPWERPDTEVVSISAPQLEEMEIRIGTATIVDDTARVPVVIIRQPGFGLFGTRIFVDERTVSLVRRNGRWFITTTLPLVYPELQPARPPAVPSRGG